MDSTFIADAYFLTQAIDQAVNGLRRLPKDYGSQVGCVLVDSNGIIIAKANNEIVADTRFHAEELVLLGTDGKDLSDATLYITKEPCNGNKFHTRRHCCEQIADAGISRVVLGSLKATYEGGADYLRQKGVEVDLLENDAIKKISMLLTAPRVDKPLTRRVLSRITQLRSEIRNY